MFTFCIANCAHDLVHRPISLSSFTHPFDEVVAQNEKLRYPQNKNTTVKTCCLFTRLELLRFQVFDFALELMWLLCWHNICMCTTSICQLNEVYKYLTFVDFVWKFTSVSHCSRLLCFSCEIQHSWFRGIAEIVPIFVAWLFDSPLEHLSYIEYDLYFESINGTDLWQLAFYRLSLHGVPHEHPREWKNESKSDSTTGGGRLLRRWMSKGQLIVFTKQTKKNTHTHMLK